MTTQNQTEFEVRLTADFFDDSGKPKYPDVGLSVLAGAPIRQTLFREHRAEIGPDQVGSAQALIVMTPRVTQRSLAHSDDLLAIIRFGVGYDSVDIPACTAANVAVVITVGAVDRPVAEATVGWMIALSHHFLVKDRLARQGDWKTHSRYMGSEVRDRTLGLVGCGGIGQALVKLLAGWGMAPPMVYDPHLNPEKAAELGIRLVSLDVVLREADFVSIHCPLNQKTRGLVGPDQLALMKPTAFLINTARGGIVDEEGLYRALKNGQIAGAAIDCFVEEPSKGVNRFAEFDNVLLAPHSVAWTNELFRDIGRSACQAAVDLTARRRPRGVVNPEVFAQTAFQEKWQRLCPK